MSSLEPQTLPEARAPDLRRETQSLVRRGLSGASGARLRVGQGARWGGLTGVLVGPGSHWGASAGQKPRHVELIAAQRRAASKRQLLRIASLAPLGKDTDKIRRKRNFSSRHVHARPDLRPTRARCTYNTHTSRSRTSTAFAPQFFMLQILRPSFVLGGGAATSVLRVVPLQRARS